MLDLFTLNVICRIAAGRQVLDLYDPEWRNYVSVLTFDITSTCRCVLGQLAEYKGGDDWWTMLAVLDMTTAEAEGYGFDVGSYGGTDPETPMAVRELQSQMQDREYAALQVGWEQVLIAA
jgi:hypothetical protein